MLCFIALWGVRAHENVEHSQRRDNIYSERSRVVELLLQLEIKRQIMQKNVETQHKHMHSFHIGLLCNVTFLHLDFTGVRGNLIAINLALNFMNSLRLSLIRWTKWIVYTVCWVWLCNPYSWDECFGPWRIFSLNYSTPSRYLSLT